MVLKLYFLIAWTLSTAGCTSALAGTSNHSLLSHWILGWHQPMSKCAGNVVVHCAKHGGARRGNYAYHELDATCFLVSVYPQAFPPCSGRSAATTSYRLHLWECLLGLCHELGSLFLRCSCKKWWTLLIMAIDNVNSPLLGYLYFHASGNARDTQYEALPRISKVWSVNLDCNHLYIFIRT